MADRSGGRCVTHHIYGGFVAGDRGSLPIVTVPAVIFGLRGAAQSGDVRRPH